METKKRGGKGVVLGLLIFILPAMCQATSITFTSNGTIGAGDVYSYVYVENNGTVVSMTGGQIGNLQTSNISTFNLYGGQVKKVHSTDTGPNVFVGSLGVINIFSGLVEIGDFVLMGDSCALIQGGEITATRMKTYKNSSITISEGVFNCDMINIGGELNIYGGQLDIKDSWGTNGIVNIYGYNFNYDPIGDPFWGGGTLIGYLMDGNSFVINGLSQDEFEHFNLIPEPATVLLFGFGWLLFRKQS